MKNRAVRLNGQTDSQGNFLMSNRQEMQEFFKQWPGKHFVMNIEVSHGGVLSRPLVAYYYRKIVPDMQQAFYQVGGERLTQEQTDLRLREASPLCIKERYDGTAGRWDNDVLKIEQLDNQLLVFFIEHLKEMAAAEYQVYIEEPGEIVNQ